MKRTVSLLALTALVILTSCWKKDDTILYRDVTMATATGPSQFVTDLGITYNVVKSEVEGDFSGLGRVLIYCNVLKYTGTNEFDIQLVNLITPLNKDAVATSTLTKPDDGLGNDPIGISAAWVSGGYLNMSIGVLMLDEEKEHRINLEFDDTAPADTLRFTLRHDDGMPDDMNVIAEDSKIGVAYVTFPIAKLLPEGVKTLPIKLTWTWDKEYCSKDDLKL